MRLFVLLSGYQYRVLCVLLFIVCLLATHGATRREPSASLRGSGGSSSIFSVRIEEHFILITHTSWVVGKQFHMFPVLRYCRVYVCVCCIQFNEKCSLFVKCGAFHTSFNQ